MCIGHASRGRFLHCLLEVSETVLIRPPDSVCAPCSEQRCFLSAVCVPACMRCHGVRVAPISAGPPDAVQLRGQWCSQLAVKPVHPALQQHRGAIRVQLPSLDMHTNSARATPASLLQDSTEGCSLSWVAANVPCNGANHGPRSWVRWRTAVCRNGDPSLPILRDEMFIYLNKNADREML